MFAEAEGGLEVSRSRPLSSFFARDAMYANNANTSFPNTAAAIK
jgi:hypothetical protein